MGVGWTKRMEGLDIVVQPLQGWALSSFFFPRVALVVIYVQVFQTYFSKF